MLCPGAGRGFQHVWPRRRLLPAASSAWHQRRSLTPAAPLPTRGGGPADKQGDLLAPLGSSRVNLARWTFPAPHRLHSAGAVVQFAAISGRSLLDAGIGASKIP